MRLRNLVHIGVCLLVMAVFADMPRAAAEEATLLTPTSGWLVGPATATPLADAGISLPCVMMTQFNNGFTLRLSVGGGRLFAVAVDFRQNIFDPGSRHDVRIAVPPDFETAVTATAHNAGILLLDLQDVATVYESFQTGPVLRLTIGESRFDFALLGMAEGLQRSETCYQNQANQSSGPAAVR